MRGVHAVVGAVARGLGRPAEPGGLVLAVSGGADSVALFRAALVALPRREDVPVTVAHFNHTLRGPAGDADEAFVRELTHAHPGVRFVAGRADVAAEAARGGENLEAAARRLRYAWLAEVARACGARRVATGHTADDQAETVLHRLLRGSGVRGLRGVARRRPLADGVDLVRPMLGVTRAQVEDYLRSLGQPYREDATNADPGYTRNRLRRELLPLLARDYNPAVVAVLGRLAEQAAELHAAEDEAGEELRRRAELPRAGALLVFDVTALSLAARWQVRAMFRGVWRREGFPLDAMPFAAWERLADVARGAATAVNLPGGLHARRKGKVVQVGPRPAS